MTAHAEWTFVGATLEGQQFLVGGLDVWQHAWIDTKKVARVQEPSYGQSFTFAVYEI